MDHTKGKGIDNFAQSIGSELSRMKVKDIALYQARARFIIKLRGRPPSVKKSARMKRSIRETIDIRR